MRDEYVPLGSSMVDDAAAIRRITLRAPVFMLHLSMDVNCAYATDLSCSMGCSLLAGELESSYI